MRYLKTAGLILIAMFAGFFYANPSVTGALAPYFSKVAEVAKQPQGELTNFVGTLIVFTVLSLIAAAIAVRLDGHGPK